MNSTGYLKMSIRLKKLNSKIPVCSVIAYGTTIKHDFCQSKFMMLLPNASTGSMQVHEGY